MSVQVEHGHIKIATELLEFMCSFRIPGMERQVFDAIMRKTWGWHKREDSIPNSQIVQLTGLKKANVNRSIKKLVEHNLVIVSDNKLSINKVYTSWKQFGGDHFNPKKLSEVITEQLSEVITPVIGSDNKKLSEVMDSIATTKATSQKLGKNPASADAFFSDFLNPDNEVVCAKATEFDVRPKDIAYCARMAMEWYRGKETENHNAIWWDSSFNRWITRSIRRHELKTNADKVAEEKKPVASGEDRWIEEHVQIVEGT